MALKFIPNCSTDSIDSINGMVVNKWQASSWSNADPDIGHCMVSFGHKKLRH